MKPDTYMLWPYSPKSMEDDIGKGIDYYTNKYGIVPTLVTINPLVGALTIRSIECKTDKAVQINHVWIGVRE